MTIKLASHNDVHLNSDQAADTIHATLNAHESKFEDLQQRWQNWQKRRQDVRTALQVLEEIQLWRVRFVIKLGSHFILI